LIVAPAVNDQLTELLSESVAFAAHEFITGPLLDNPHRLDRQLRPPLIDRLSAGRGTYRVIYRIDDQRRRLTVVDVFSRADVYRPR
jgi:mRNA-degrading endonuclease RelE of RelBE toxin-antitoxin system